MNINFNTATRGKLQAPHFVSRWELIPCLWLKMWANFPKATQGEFSLSNRDVRGNLCFLSQVEWTPRGSDSKVGLISLQWLKFRFFFHLTRWRHVESTVKIVENTVGVCLIWTGRLTSLWPSRDSRNSMLHNVMMPDSSWKWIGIPNHCANQKGNLGLLPHLQKRPYCFAKANLDSWGVHLN